MVDIFTCFGKVRGSARRVSPEMVRDAMASHGIARALTYSLRGVFDDAAEGNRETLMAVADGEDLVGLGTLDPRRHLDVEAEARFCVDHGCAGFVFFPREQGWSYDSLAFRRCVGAIRPLAVPVLATVSDWSEVGQVARVAGEYGVSTVLCGVHYSQMAEGIAAALEFPSVHIETHRLATPGAVEILAGEIGAERILFGSGAPVRPLGSPLNAIRMADVPEQEKLLILGGNAEKLFFGARISSKTGGDVAPPAVRRCRYEGPVVDVHAHLGPLPYPIRPETVDLFLDRCRRYGIAQAIVSSLVAIRYDMREGNRALVEAIAEKPQLLAYVVVDPNDLEGSRAELDRYRSHPKVVGVKIHCGYAGKTTGSPAIERLVAEVARIGKPLLIHNDGPDWAGSLAALALEHPQLAFIIAHGFLTPSSITEVCSAVCPRPNVYLEFGNTFPETTAIPEALGRVGPGRVLFGSDQGLIDPAYVLGTYEECDVGPAEVRMIMSENAQRLFRLPPLPGGHR